MKRSRFFMGMAILLAVFLSACVHKGPLLVGFQYQPPKAAAAETLKATVGVSPFKDQRGKSDSVVGRRYLSLNDVSNELVVQGTVLEKVTAALKSALTAREITVQDKEPWDLTDAGIPTDGADLLVSGEIKTLWVESTSSLANTKVKADVQLRIVVADIAQKKIIRTLNVSSAIERQSVAYSTEVVDNTLSEAVSTAINQIFADDELKNRLQ